MRTGGTGPTHNKVLLLEKKKNKFSNRTQVCEKRGENAQSDRKKMCVSDAFEPDGNSTFWSQLSEELYPVHAWFLSLVSVSIVWSPNLTWHAGIAAR